MNETHVQSGGSGCTWVFYFTRRNKAKEERIKEMLLFWKILFTEFIAEMGDKTQLMLVALTSKYKIRDIILGTAAAILVLNGLAVLAGGIVSEFVPTWVIRLIAAAAFLFFALTSLGGDDDEEEDASGKGKFAFAPLTVFCTFFVAELGDKTQLTAITFGANEGLNAAITVWLACSIGLFAADMIGMLIGYLLKSRMPEGFLHILAFIIFSIYGIVTVNQGLGMMPGAQSDRALPVTIGIAVIFAVLCVIRFIRQRERK
jgi:putative Ca2+/H+ antiporter (TMEM165/GDT1 family)